MSRPIFKPIFIIGLIMAGHSKRAVFRCSAPLCGIFLVLRWGEGDARHYQKVETRVRAGGARNGKKWLVADGLQFSWERNARRTEKGKCLQEYQTIIRWIDGAWKFRATGTAKWSQEVQDFDTGLCDTPEIALQKFKEETRWGLNSTVSGPTFFGLNGKSIRGKTAGMYGEGVQDYLRTRRAAYEQVLASQNAEPSTENVEPESAAAGRTPQARTRSESRAAETIRKRKDSTRKALDRKKQKVLRTLNAESSTPESALIIAASVYNDCVKANGEQEDQTGRKINLPTPHDLQLCRIAIAQFFNGKGGRSRTEQERRRRQEMLTTFASLPGMTVGVVSRFMGRRVSQSEFDAARRRAIHDKKEEDCSKHIFFDKRARRRDAYPDDWGDLAAEFWKAPDISTQLESTARLGDKVLYALDVTPSTAHMAFVTHLRERFKALQDPDWQEKSVGLKWFCSHRPDTVRTMSKVTCACPYHLNYFYLAEALLRNLRRWHRPSRSIMGGCLDKDAECDCGMKIPKTHRDLRHKLSCERVSVGEHKYVQWRCRERSCGTCPSLVDALTQGQPCKIFHENSMHEMTWSMKRTVRAGKGKDMEDKSKGTKNRSDFVQHEDRPVKEFIAAFQRFIDSEDFFQHHHVTHIQSRAHRYCTENIAQGTAIGSIDYSQNYARSGAIQTQEEFFNCLQATVISLVLTLRADDLKAGVFPETAEQNEAYMKANHLVVGGRIRVSLTFISPDMVHDGAFASHCVGKMLEWLHANTKCSKVIMWSDGARQQFKNRHYFGGTAELVRRNRSWLERYDHHFFCSCHGKGVSDCDAAASKNHLNNYLAENCERHFKNVKHIHQVLCCVKMEQPQRRYRAKKDGKGALGMYRRVFFYIPKPGTAGSVKRSEYASFKKWPDRCKSSKMHRFIYTKDNCSEKGLKVLFSAQSCPTFCDACRDLNFDSCENKILTGPIGSLELKAAEQRESWTKKKALDLGSSLKVKDVVGWVDSFSATGYSVGMVKQIADYIQTETECGTFFFAERLRPDMTVVSRWYRPEEFPDGEVVRVPSINLLDSDVRIRRQKRVGFAQSHNGDVHARKRSSRDFAEPSWRPHKQQTRHDRSECRRS